MIRMVVNGQVREVTPDEDEPLLWTLRDRLGLTGTKYGCGVGYCGACTVMVDGVATRSCSLRAIDAHGATLVTIETTDDPVVERVRRAWTEHQVPQCGYCQPGFVMAAAAALAAEPEADAEALLSRVTNVCRCGTYGRIRAAVRSLVGA